MQFLNPLGLLLLGLIPILIWLHSLKPKAKQVPVTTFFLWQEALKEQPAGLRTYKLLKNLPLIFQILIIVLSALALFQPVWLWNTQQYSNMILVLDTSASMKTQVSGQSRFERAQAQALDLIEDMPPLSQAIIIESGRIPKVKTNFTSDKAALRQALKTIQPTETAGNLTKSVFLALSFFSSVREDRIFVLTDGAGREIENITGVHKNITPLLIQGGHDNVGITKFSFRQELIGEDHYEVLLEIKNFNTEPQDVPVQLKINNTLLTKQSVTIPAGEKALLFFPYSGKLSGIAQARLEREDDFVLDNQAYTVLVPPKPIKVLFVSEGNYFLERLLAAHPNFIVEKRDTVDAEAWPALVEQSDIVVMDRIAPPATLAGNFLLIEAFSPQLPFVAQGKTEAVRVLDWDKNHRILENLDLSDTTLQSTTRIKAEAGLLPIIESPQSGLVYAYEKKNLRAVLFAFDLTHTNLPRKVAFPILMNNVFRWLFPYKFEFASFQTKAGTTYPLHLRKPLQAVTIQTPSGKKETYLPEASPFPFLNTKEVGIYLAQQGRNHQFFAVNLLDENESDITVPKYQAGNPQSALSMIAESAIAAYHLWLILFFLAVLFLMMEWYFWIRLR